MYSTRVFLFQGSSFVIPESVRDDEIPLGIEPETVERDFGRLEYCSVLPPGSAGLPMECFLLPDDAKLPPGWRSMMIRQILSNLAAMDGYLRCYHILQWRNESLYCGSCGERNGDSPVELARLCPRCGRIEYPRISPAVIILITDEKDRVLLAHNKKFRNNMYSLIAGFAEAGESLEAAACREIKEELNIEVKELCYIRSQSWPFPNSLMAGFTACFAGGELRPDGDELMDARWFTRETIKKSTDGTDHAEDACFVPDLPGYGSISRYLIDRWLLDSL